MPTRRIARLIILSRVLTRSGDHAWELALSLALVTLFPAGLRPLAIYQLSVRLAVVLAIPSLGRWMDRELRLTTVRWGIGLQTAGLAGFALLLGPVALLAAPPAPALPGLVVSGIALSLGSAIMNIAIPADWVPTVFGAETLARVNSRFKQVDLGTEIGAPVLAGVIMGAAAVRGRPLAGFLIVLALDAASFLAEYLALLAAYRACPALHTRPAGRAAATATAGPLAMAVSGARSFWSQPTAPVMAAYSLLWFTVLAPHGVLLTSFLKSVWRVPEATLGFLRGAGAICGLMPTLVSDRLVRRFGLPAVAAGSITFQAVCLGLACTMLHRGAGAAGLFIAWLLVSRLGLYGFVLAELQIRQEAIPDGERGTVNGFASSLNQLCGLAVYLMALLFAEPKEFVALAWSSLIAVSGGALIVNRWLRRTRRARLDAASGCTG